MPAQASNQKGVAMKMPLCAVVAVAAAVAIVLPASASATPPVPVPPGSECTFDSGVTTCVKTTESTQEWTSRVEDENCPSGIAESRRFETTTDRTTYVFHGMDPVGEPQTETTIGFGSSYGCVPQ
jgi:hypothetical protein